MTFELNVMEIQPHIRYITYLLVLLSIYIMTAVATNKTRVRQQCIIGNNGGQSDISFALNLLSLLA